MVRRYLDPYVPSSSPSPDRVPHTLSPGKDDGTTPGRVVYPVISGRQDSSHVSRHVFYRGFSLNNNFSKLVEED